MRVVALADLERIDFELRRELVEQTLESEGALDEAGRAERCEGAGVGEDAGSRGASVGAAIHLQPRHGDRRNPCAVGAHIGEAIDIHCRQGAIAPGT